jgi:glucoamylase
MLQNAYIALTCHKDGPALRATAMIEYANWLLKNSSVSNVVNNLWPIIKLDLDYVAADWNQTTYVAGISVQLYSE